MPLPAKRSPQSEIQKPICIVDGDESVSDSLQDCSKRLGSRCSPTVPEADSWLMSGIVRQAVC